MFDSRSKAQADAAARRFCESEKAAHHTSRLRLWLLCEVLLIG
ncbi:hypothetical protein PCH70_44130 [Pseudomonas cichorii JBC1]|nr:hypothetical protein PCH70_44130 [Pseudomonas cichorii JBC1]